MLRTKFFRYIFSMVGSSEREAALATSAKLRPGRRRTSGRKVVHKVQKENGEGREQSRAGLERINLATKRNRLFIDARTYIEQRKDFG